MPKTAKPKEAKAPAGVQSAQAVQAGAWSYPGAWSSGSVSASNIAPTWATVSPNIQWQGTSSGATYTAASSVLPK